MWVLLALFSALCSGTTWVLSKGASRCDAQAAIALRSVVLFGSALLFALCFGSRSVFIAVDFGDCWGAMLSGVSAALSWVCFQKALQGGLGRAAAMEKLSVLPIAWAEWRFFGVQWSWGGLLALGMILAGAVCMAADKSITIDKQAIQGGGSWWVWMTGTVLLTAITGVLAKWSVSTLAADAALTIRTGVSVLTLLGWMGVAGTLRRLSTVRGKDRWLLTASGISSALAWICYYYALRGGNASTVHGLDKLSVIVTSFAGWLLFEETYSRQTLRGMGILVGGLLLLLFAH